MLMKAHKKKKKYFLTWSMITGHCSKINVIFYHFRDKNMKSEKTLIEYMLYNFFILLGISVDMRGQKLSYLQRFKKHVKREFLYETFNTQRDLNIVKQFLANNVQKKRKLKHLSLQSGSGQGDRHVSVCLLPWKHSSITIFATFSQFLTLHFSASQLPYKYNT